MDIVPDLQSAFPQEELIFSNPYWEGVEVRFRDDRGIVWYRPSIEKTEYEANGIEPFINGVKIYIETIKEPQ